MKFLIAVLLQLVLKTNNCEDNKIKTYLLPLYRNLLNQFRTPQDA